MLPYICDNPLCEFHVEVHISPNSHTASAVLADGTVVRVPRHRYRSRSKVEYYLCDTCQEIQMSNEIVQSKTLSNEIVQSKTFEQKMSDRIRESIGDLIDDATLSRLIEASIQKLFFEPVVVPGNGSWNSQSTIKPSVLQDLIKELLEEQVRALVAQHLKDNADTFEGVVRDIVQQGIGKAVFSAFETKFSGDLYTLQANIVSSLQRG